MSAPINFAEQLAKQLRFLETSCREYDAGNQDEAIRLATVLRVIFHNTAASTSLLLHLGATGINMLSTCGKRQSDHPRGYWQGFVEVVFAAMGHKIKRNRLILDAANKDGGAHVDASLPADYRWMIEGTDFKFAVEKSNGVMKEAALPAPHLACLRQIAYEVFGSPDLMKLAGRT
jgi:hypothetical protein